jgi:hypothetical protein
MGLTRCRGPSPPRTPSLPVTTPPKCGDNSIESAVVTTVTTKSVARVHTCARYARVCIYSAIHLKFTLPPYKGGDGGDGGDNLGKDHAKLSPPVCHHLFEVVT